MSALKDRLRTDLTAAMKARESVKVGTLRMALAAITNAEVAGEVAQQLSDQEVIGVLAKEVRKRNEAAEIYAAASRPELAEKELAEGEVLTAYLPSQLTDEEVAALVAEAVAEATEAAGAAPTMKQMGVVIKAAQTKVAGRADGSRVAAAVKAALG